jgi:hypothetical protein
MLRKKHHELSAEFFYKNEHYCVEQALFVLQKKTLEISKGTFEKSFCSVGVCR